MIRAQFTVLSLVVAATLISCSRPLDLNGIDNENIPVALVAEATKQKVFVATTRQASGAEELAKLDLRVIDLSQISDSRTGSHSKTVGSPEVVQLIGEGIRTSSRFGRRSKVELTEFIAGAPISIVSN